VNQDVDVIVVGAGPVGLVLAAELALTGATATVQVLEPRVEPDTAIRAQLINVSTAEALDLVDHGHGGGFLLLDRTPDGAFARLATAWAGRVNSATDNLRHRPGCWYARTGWSPMPPMPPMPTPRT